MLYLDYSRESMTTGSPTNTVDARTWKRSTSCVKFNVAVHEEVPRRCDRGGRVDRLARRVASDLRRRTRFHLQVEHGLDE